MIVEAIVNLITGLVDVLVGIAPDLTLPFGTYPTQFANFAGSQLAGLNTILPITELAIVVGWVLSLYVPVVFTFYVVRWIWAHVPFI